MIDSTSWQPNPFYLACSEKNIQKARQTARYVYLNEADNDRNTPLHIACRNGDIELVKLLFRYRADRTIKNKQDLTAEQMATTDEIKQLFKNQTRPKTESDHFGTTEPDVEWMDNYKNAYRIAYENREHMKRWLLKVPLKKLLDEIDIGYIDKMEFSSDKCKQEIKDYLQMVIDYEQPAGLITAYTTGGTCFCTKLNYDLAEIGSNFRFLSTQNLFNSGYLDNEAPKGLGAHIYAAILSNHSIFQSRYHTGITYRGMSLTPNGLAQYKINDIVLTRSLLSTSKVKQKAELFLATTGNQNQPNSIDGEISVMCVYQVIKSSIKSLYQ